MHRILAITNQKGGVGKTTTSVNLAASLAATKRRVLLIDIDPQGNATMGCGVDKRTVERSTTDVLLGDCEAAAALLDLDYAEFKLMPANQDLVAAEVQLMGKAGCESRLRDALQPVRDQFDVVLIDCPPALNMLTVNALVAADGVLIPDAVRVLRARRADGARRHDRADQGRPESRAWRSTASCAPCSIRETTSRTKFRRS